jgi:hypothetical protein
MPRVKIVLFRSFSPPPGILVGPFYHFYPP